MTVFMLVPELLACYFPAVAGARGRGSRKLWIGSIFVGLFISLGTIWLVKALNVPMSSYGTTETFFDIIRTALAFAFGSFLATLLFKKKQSIEDLSLK